MAKNELVGISRCLEGNQNRETSSAVWTGIEQDFDRHKFFAQFRVLYVKLKKWMFEIRKNMAMSVATLCLVVTVVSGIMDKAVIYGKSVI